MRSYVLILLTFFTVYVGNSAKKSQPEILNSYFQYLSSYPDTLGPTGKASQGEIEIIKGRKKDWQNGWSNLRW